MTAQSRPGTPTEPPLHAATEPHPGTRPTTAQLEALAAVAQCGSISAAARALGLAQPTVSTTLARLERLAATRLLVRSHAGVRLTASGQEVLESAQVALAALDEVAATLARLQSAGADTNVGATRPVRIAASYTIAEHLLPVWLATCPVPTAIEVRNSEEVQREVLAGDVELGFVEGPDVAEGLTARTLGTDELVLVVCPEHPWAGRATPVTAGELIGSTGAGSAAGAGTSAGAGGGPTSIVPAHAGPRHTDRQGGPGHTDRQAGSRRTDRQGGPRRTDRQGGRPAGRFLVVREPGSGARAVLDKALAEAGYSLPADVAVMGSNAALLTAVAHAGAHAVLAEEAAASAIASGAAVRVPTTLDLRRRLRLVRPASAHLAPAAAQMVTLLATRATA